MNIFDGRGAKIEYYDRKWMIDGCGGEEEALDTAGEKVCEDPNRDKCLKM